MIIIWGDVEQCISWEDEIQEELKSFVNCTFGLLYSSYTPTYSTAVRDTFDALKMDINPGVDSLFEFKKELRKLDKEGIIIDPDSVYCDYIEGRYFMSVLYNKGLNV